MADVLTPTTIGVRDFANLILSTGVGKNAGVCLEQVEEALGGLANLYLASAFDAGMPDFEIDTSSVVISDVAPRSAVIGEIKDCTGASSERSALLLDGIAEAVRDRFEEEGYYDVPIEFLPIGSLEVRDLSKSEYRLTYRDPAVTRYGDFLGAGAEKPPIATIVHISDLHFAKTFTTDETLFRHWLSKIPGVQGAFGHSYQAAGALAARVIQVVTNRREHGVPVCVAATGDVTYRGGEAEMVVASTYLRSAHATSARRRVGLALGDPAETVKSGNAAVFLVPGNHDIRGRKNPKTLGAYKRHFPGDFPSRCVLESAPRPVVIHGLDSTQNTVLRHRLARGRIPEEEIAAVCELLEKERDSDAIQVVCLHHPLQDAERSEIDPSMALDDREIVARRLFDAGADLVLAGHIHEYLIAPRDEARCTPNHVVAGTGCQQFSSRSFMVCDFYDEGVMVTALGYDGETRQFRFAQAMPLHWG